MKWTPVISFVQVLIDAMNAMVTVPGEFKSFGHDYRADTADFVNAGFDLPSMTAEQMASIGETLVGLELDRAKRIKGDSGQSELDSMEAAVGNVQ
jgi:uncharacterized membrane protein